MAGPDFFSDPRTIQTSAGGVAGVALLHERPRGMARPRADGRLTPGTPAC